MPTRYNVKPKDRLGVPGLPTGFQQPSSPDINIPPVGLEDVDVALFTLFDKEIPFQVTGRERVPVVFASGEKWAMLKRDRAIRDKNGTLILPLITIGRDSVQQSLTDDITGRGTNQQTGEIVVKRKLARSQDRDYQSLVNRMLLTHQPNVAVDPSLADDGQVTTLRAQGDLADDPDVIAGGLLRGDVANNVWEVIVVPAPQFCTLMYEVILWTQYSQHMNQLVEQVMSSFLPQGNAWRLDTPKGYWFVATVENNTYTAENNFDDMSQGERTIQYKFNVKVPAYVLASSTPGAPIPVRRYISSPEVTFDVSVDVLDGAEVDEPFLGADDPTLPLSDGSSRRRDRRADGGTRLYPSPTSVVSDDPALANSQRGVPPARFEQLTYVDDAGKTVTKRVRVVNVNRYTGETVYVPGGDRRVR